MGIFIECLCFQPPDVAPPHHLCQRLKTCFLSRPLYLVTLSELSIFTVLLPIRRCEPSHCWNDLGYCSAASAAPPAPPILCVVTTSLFLPPSALRLHTNSGLAWSGSEAVTEEWKPFVILTDYRGGFIGTCTSNSPYSGTTCACELCSVSSLISPRGTRVQLVTSVAAAKCRVWNAEVSFYRQN